MALLDDLDLDKILGTKNPVGGLINDPNAATNLDIDALLGGATGYYDSLYKGYSIPKKLVNTFAGAKAGRQSGIDRYTKNYLTQQDIVEKALGIKLKQSDLAKSPYELAKLKFEVDTAPYNLQKAKDEAYKSSLWSRGVRDEIKRLYETEQYDLIAQLEVDPNGYFEAKRGADPRFRKQSEYSVAEENIAKTMGLDIKNPSSWTQDEKDAFTYIITRPSQEKMIELRRAEKVEQLKDRNYVPQNDYSNMEALSAWRQGKLNELMGKSNGQTQSLQGGYSPEKNAQPQTASNNRPSTSTNIRPQTFGPEEGYPEGGFYDWQGQKYTKEEWQNKGSVFRNANNTVLSKDEYVKKLNKAELDAEEIAGTARYMFENFSETNRIIREVLSNPQAIKDMQSMGGKAFLNLNLARYGITNLPQDTSNLLDVIRNQQFINSIQIMRANNKTGGAVGNVSDKEVMMFISASGALQNTNSPEQMYKELVKLHQKAERVMQNQKRVYTNYYGVDNYNLSEMDIYLNDVLSNNTFLSYKDALFQKNKNDRLDVIESNENVILDDNDLILQHLDKLQKKNQGLGD